MIGTPVRASQVVPVVKKKKKKPPASAGDKENPLDRGIWRAILESIASQRVGHDRSDLAHTHIPVVHYHDNVETHTHMHTHIS